VEIRSPNAITNMVIWNFAFIFSVSEINVVAPSLADQSVHGGVSISCIRNGELREFGSLVQQFSLEQSGFNVEELIRLADSHHDFWSLDNNAALVGE